VESAINVGGAKNDQTLGRVESALDQVMQFPPTVRADMNELSAKLDKIVEERQKEMTDLNAELDALKADIQALPH
jgi:peptidoglycan hydrolase CwlO-like protein